MSENTLDGAAADLINTINEAVKSGLDTLPGSAEMAVNELVNYYIADSIVSAAWMLLLPIVVYYLVKLASLSNAKFEETRSASVEVGCFVSMITGIIFTIISGILFVVSAISFSTSIIKAIAPIGSILAGKL